MTTDTELRDLLAAEAGGLTGGSGGWEDVTRRGRRRQRMRRVQLLAVVAVVAVVSMTAITLSFDDQAVVTTPAADQPAPRAPDLPPVLRESGALDRGTFVERMAVLDGGLPSWQDPLDTDVGFVDVERVQFSGQDGGQPSWDIELAAKPPLPADREPGLQIAYGLVFDTTGDGIADYVVGIDNDTPVQGEYHIWLTDLATGGTHEQIGPLYGWPIEFSHPADQPPGLGPPSMFFTFLPGTAPSDLNPENVRFYAWTSATRDGEIIASDFAPDAGWLG